jgi:PAS domain S-box-containing protein
VEYTLKQLLDIPRLQELLGSLDELNSIPSAILDNEGNILIATSWQDICTEFHRVNPETAKKCFESDLRIDTGLAEKMPYVSYNCPMGLVDAAIPIVIEGKHLGNTYVGQFFLKAPEEAHFIEQAYQYGFDKDEYLKAVRKVPIYTEEQFRPKLAFIGQLAHMLAEQGLQCIRQREAAKALISSEEKFAKAFSACPALITIVSMDDGRYLDVNEALFETTGYNREEVIGHTSLELNFWLDSNERQRYLDELNKNGFLRNYVAKYRMRNNEVRDFLVSSEIIDIDQKRFSLNFILDITERTRAEESVKKSEYFFKESQRSAFIGSYQADFIANRWESSEVLDTIFGIDDDYERSIPGWLNIVHPDDRDLMDRYLIEEVISNRKPFSKEYRILRQNDGEERWVNGRGSAEFDSDGNILSLMGTIQDITEQKLVEDSLRGSDERFRNYVTLSPHGVFITDDKGHFTDVNNAASAITGYSPDELLTMNIYDLLPPESMEWAANSFQQLLETGHTGGEAAYRRKNGEIGYWSLAAVKLPTANFMGIVTDVTDRIHALEELANTRATLAAAFEQSPVPIVLVSMPEAVFSIVNTACREFLGMMDEPDPTGTLFANFKPTFLEYDSTGNLIPITEAPLALTLQGLSTLGQERKIVTKDGKVKWALVSANPIYNAQGKLIAAYLVFPDITEHKLAKLADARYLLRQRAVLDNLPMMAWLKDTESCLQMVNEMYAKACGRSVEECIGKTDMELFPLEMAKQFIADDKEVCLSGQKKQVEESIATPDGEKWHITHKTPIFDEQGHIVGTAGIAHDITSIKESEKERSRLEANLHQAQKMESVGRLAGGVAHDFNNMLSVILGHAELGQLKIDQNHPIQAHLKEISKTAERSADLTRQLLAFARKQTIAPKVVNLNEAVATMLNMLQRLIGEDVSLIWKPAATLWPIKVDTSQIDQILTNLCVNARDAIADVGEISIETGNCSTEESYYIVLEDVLPGEYVKLSVTDSGVGMDRETIAHIFEPFYTTKELGKGTGLGLATIYGAVKQNNGFIDVHSEPGIGTTFTIYLPRYEGKATLEIMDGVKESSLRGQETILLVEDEPSILNIVSMVLSQLGYTVLEANTPGEAILRASEYAGEIHLLMTDVVMPEMNGRDLAKNLLSIYPNMKRLFMSGYTADVIAHHGVLDDGVHFIQKPFNMNIMSAKLREVLDSK